MDNFRAARIKESVADFEEAARLKPELKAQLWQLGISYYYAGEFEKGRQLFELHRTVNPEDVENAAWHFLCVAKLKGVEAARKSLIPVTEDGRRPMKEIYECYAGKAKRSAVLTAADNGEDEQAFYAHLYLGLFEEAAGHPEKSLTHMKTAVRLAPNHYMGDVARVHLKLRAKSSSESEPPARP